MKTGDININVINSINQNYLVISKMDFFSLNKIESDDYRVKMLKKNKIDGLLTMSKRVVDNECKYYYDINSLKTVRDVWSRKLINYDELLFIMNESIELINKLEEYLLDENNVLLNPEYMYVDKYQNRIRFAYYPDYNGNNIDNFMELMDFIIARLDHQDSRAVDLAYALYKYSRSSNFEVNQMLNIIYESKKNNAAVQNVTQMYEVAQEYNPEENEVNGTSELKRKIQLPSSLIGAIISIVIGTICGVLFFGNESLGKYTLYVFVMTFVSFLIAIIFSYSYIHSRKITNKFTNCVNDCN